MLEGPDLGEEDDRTIPAWVKVGIAVVFVVGVVLIVYLLNGLGSPQLDR